MKKWVTLSMVCSLLVPSIGAAQVAADVAPVVDPATTPIDPVVEQHGHTTEEPVAAAAPEEEAAEEEHHWYDDLSVNLYADAYYMLDWNRPTRADAQQQVAHRAYDFTNGFALAFAGLDLNYTREHFGATMSLIYGRGADRYLIGTYTPGFFPLKQAFVSYMPMEGLSFDVGQFDTPFGAEVAQSWLNLNYSRTPLNYLMQPFYHTGLRATWQATDSLMVRGLLVNGVNNGIDSNLVPSVGAQVGFTPNDSLALYAGYLGGSPDAMNQHDPNVGAFGRSNAFRQHFFDFVLTATVAEKLKLVLNADLWVFDAPGTGKASRPVAGGVSATAGYQITDTIGVAARLDYLNNADGFFFTGTGIPAAGANGIGQYGVGYSTSALLNPWKHLGVATLTLDYRPFGNHAIFRLEQRLEYADTKVFPDGNFGVGDPSDPLVQAQWANDVTKFWTSTTLSLVVQMAD